MRTKAAAALVAAAAFVLTTLAVLTTAAGAAVAGAVAQGGADAALEVVGLGFAGRARMGAWTPVWVDVTAPPAGIDGTVRIEAPSPAGRPVMTFAVPVRAAAGARVRVFVPSIFFDARAPGSAHLEDARGRVATVVLPRVRSVDDVVVALSSEPLGIEPVVGRGSRTEVTHLAAEWLPPVWQTYEAVRLLVVRDLDERRVEDRQREALRDWVLTGGRLLAMPAADDRRHMQGPTLRPLFGRARDGRLGRGRVTQWVNDAADPRIRGGSAGRQAWEQALTDARPTPALALETTLPAGRVIPLRVHLIVAACAILYVLAVRWFSRTLARMRLATVAIAVVAVAAATWSAAALGAAARREASGTVTSIVIEGLPGLEQGVVNAAVRTLSTGTGAFHVGVGSGLLLRPGPPASVTVVFGQKTALRGESTTIQLTGSAVLPLAVTGELIPAQGGGSALVIRNRSGRAIEPAWVFSRGRVLPLATVGSTARVVIDPQQWQPYDRLQRTEPNHALLMWAFSHLDADGILRATPAWLVGWTRDPSLTLQWDGRAEVPESLVLVPLPER